MRVGCAMVRHAAWVVFVAVGLTTGVARGEFVLVEDFDGLELGPIDGKDGWYASSPTSQVVTLPGEGVNQTLKATANPAVLHKSVTNKIKPGDVRMLFLRFRFEGQHNYSFGMSHLTSPVEFSDFGPELRKRAAFNRFSIHDGQNYANLTTLAPATWYNLWALVDNVSGNTQVWLHSRPREGAVAADQLDAEGQTVFNFRTNANTDLVKFYIKAAEGGSGKDPLWIDDVYLEDSDGQNLTNPVPEPQTLAGLASFALVLVCYLCGRRRRRLGSERR